MNKKNIRILIIEDEETQAKILSDFLEKEGFKIKIAENGSKALELIKKNVFDILICDYNLPDMNGLDVVQNAQEISPKSIPILTTCLNSVDIAIRGMRNGIHDYLVKPFNYDDILKVINSIIVEQEEFKDHTNKFQQLMTEKSEKIDEFVEKTKIPEKKVINDINKKPHAKKILIEESIPKEKNVIINTTDNNKTSFKDTVTANPIQDEKKSIFTSIFNLPEKIKISIKKIFG